MIEYRQGGPLDIHMVIDLYNRSTLGQRRPVDDAARMESMLKNANLIITAWDTGKLIGISRALTDWVYCTYLSDLAVDQSYQKQGIGRELIRHTRNAAPQANLILLAAPAAVNYYPKIGFTRHESAWWIKPGEELK